MDFAGTVQSVGRPGEILYISSQPNYSPVQAVPPIRGGQESFSGYSGQKNSFNSYSRNSERSGNLPSNYREIALDIQNQARSGRGVITPGMLLDISA